jgi:hypothetical protein
MAGRFRTRPTTAVARGGRGKRLPLSISIYTDAVRVTLSDLRDICDPTGSLLKKKMTGFVAYY